MASPSFPGRWRFQELRLRSNTLEVVPGFSLSFRQCAWKVRQREMYYCTVHVHLHLYDIIFGYGIVTIIKIFFLELTSHSPSKIKRKRLYSKRDLEARHREILRQSSCRKFVRSAETLYVRGASSTFSFHGLFTLEGNRCFVSQAYIRGERLR